jgi:hypothetical protein
MKSTGRADDLEGVEQITLTIAEFEHICRSLKVPEPKKGEKRRAQRVEHRAPVRVSAISSGKVGQAGGSTLRDISPNGATLNHPGTVKPGTHLVLWVEQVRLLTRVVHSKCFADGTAMVGLEFLGVMDPVRKIA